MLIIEFDSNIPILREASLAVPDASIVLEDEQILKDGRIRLLFWANSGDLEKLEHTIEKDPTVSDLQCLADPAERGRLYRVLYTEEGMEWTTHHRWVEVDATLLDSKLRNGTWTVEMRFPDQEALGEYRSLLEDRGLDFTVKSLWTKNVGTENQLDPVLTQRQRETLVRAVERGYYDVPRRINSAELAEEFGISDQALSERLRRGIASLTRQTLID
jgi:predicted DNA binding protein